jgi:hypothetical protein
MDADTTGRWLPRAEAAALLGIHERTMRRRLAAGQYQTRDQGQVVDVWLSDVAQGAPITPQGAQLNGTQGNSLAGPLRDQIDGRFRAEQAAMRQERVRNLASLTCMLGCR